LDLSVFEVKKSDLLAVDVVFVEVEDGQIPDKALVMGFFWGDDKLDVGQVKRVFFELFGVVESEEVVEILVFVGNDNFIRSRVVPFNYQVPVVKGDCV
jgi:hypothetical protein